MTAVLNLRREFLSTTRLTTVEADDPLWNQPDGDEEQLARFKSAFVRLRPGLDVSPARVEQLKQRIAAVATKVRVDAPTAAAVLPGAPPAATVVPTIGLREAVLLVAAETNTRDRAALDALLEQTLAEVGL